MKKIACSMTMAVMMMTACKDKDEVSIRASFTTDKDVYELADPVIITNTSTVENAQIALYKWEFLGKVSYEEVPSPDDIVFETTGDFTFKLTVTADKGNLESSFEKTISVVDNNIPPVADFSWAPTTVKAGETVQFTDLSTDADGQITGWEWKFGTTVVTVQNPEFTFVSEGEIEVSLTVIDNKRGKNTKTVTIDVARGEISLDLLWEQSYDNTEAYVYGSSPAVSADGQFVYVISTGYNLVCFDKEGNQKWSFDAGSDGASAIGGQNGTPADKKNPTPTPSVDTEDGTVFVAVGYNYQNPAEDTKGCIYAVNGGASGGTRKWLATPGNRTHLCFFTPVVTNDYVMIAHRNRNDAPVPPAPAANSAHLEVYNKMTGEYVFGGHCNSGSSGGILAMKSGKVVVGVGGQWGARLFFPNGPGVWQFSRPTGNDNEHNLGRYNNYHINVRSSQPAAGPGGKIYMLGRNHNAANYLPGYENTQSLVVYHENVDAFVFDTAPAEVNWVCPVKGAVPVGSGDVNGMGLAVAENGTVYTATCKEGMVHTTAWITAISANGTIKWEHQVDGDVQGVPAIDDMGFVYYNDWVNGKLVMLHPENGERIAEIVLNAELRSSPTISSDGTIYLNGMKNGRPTIFAVKGEATGCANSWSQLGGNPSKTAYMY